MAEVEHLLGDFVSMLESAWEPSNSLERIVIASDCE